MNSRFTVPVGLFCLANFASPVRAQVWCTPPFDAPSPPPTISIQSGGVVVPGSTGCMPAHKLEFGPKAMYFDTEIGMTWPGATFPLRTVAFLPADTRKFRKAATLSLQFLDSDVPTPFFTPAEMRPYGFRSNTGGTSWFWEQIAGYDPSLTIGPGTHVASGSLKTLEPTQVFAAQPGLITIDNRADGDLIASRQPMVQITVKFFDIKLGFPAACGGFTVSVNELTFPATCSPGVIQATYNVAPLLPADGPQTITAKVVGPSGDISYDAVTVDIDTVPPALSSTNPAHEDTFNPGGRPIFVRIADAHCAQTSIESFPYFNVGTVPVGGAVVPCAGESCCFRLDYGWNEPSPLAPVAVSFQLRDAAGNTSVPYLIELFPRNVGKIHGRVLHALTDNGITNMAVSIPAVTAIGYSVNGDYTIEGPPDSLNGRPFIKFDAEHDSPPMNPRPVTSDGCSCSPAADCPYASFGLVTDIVLKRGEMTLPIAQPVRLPPINEPCHGKQVGALDAMGDCVASLGSTVTVTDPVSTVVLHILPHTKVSHPDQPGFCGPWTVSVSEVPPDKTPQSLPPDMRPSIIVTVQPSGLTFDPPPAIDFPDRIGYESPAAEPNKMVLFSVDPVTDLFYERGLMTIDEVTWTIFSDPGTGVGVAGWHCPHSIQAKGGNGGGGPVPCTGRALDTGDCGCPVRSQGGTKVGGGSQIGLVDGELSVDYTLPGYRALGGSKALTFVYSSKSVNPIAMEPFDLAMPPRASVPDYIRAQYWVGTEFGPSIALQTRPKMDNDTKVSDFRFTGAADVRTLTTGIYTSRLDAVAVYLPSAFSLLLVDCQPPVREDRGITVSGNYPHVNAVDSPFGSGWGLSGLTRLYGGAGNQLMLVNGNGDRLLFSPTVQGAVGGEDIFVAGGLGVHGATGTIVNNAGMMDRGDCIQYAYMAPHAADFNGDKLPDMAVRSRFSSNDSLVFEGVPDARRFDLTAPVNLADCRDGAWSGDLDADGYDDMVCGQGSSVVIHRGQSGTPLGFAAPTTPPTPPTLVTGQISMLATGQFTDDGNLDVAVLTTAGVEVLKGDGAGGIGHCLPTACTTAVTIGHNIDDQIQVRDLDADGKDDILVTASNGLRILFSDGLGGFSADLIPMSTEANGVTLADLSGDGIAELLTLTDTDTAGHHVQIWEQGATPHSWTEAARILYSTSDLGRWIETGDFNSDGRVDLAISIWQNGFGTSRSVSILYGEPGTYNFSNGIPTPMERFTPGSPGCDWQQGWGLVVGRFGQPMGSSSGSPAAYINPLDHSRLTATPEGWEREHPDRRIDRYDHRGLLVETEDLPGNVVSYEYDPATLALARIVDAIGLETRFEYLGNRLSKVIDPAGRESVFGHDPGGRLISITDPEGNASTYGYAHPTFEYLMTSRTPPRGMAHTVLYDYDGDFGHLIQVAQPTDAGPPNLRYFSPIILQGTYPAAITDCNAAGEMFLASELEATLGDDEWGADRERYSFTLDGRISTYQRDYRQAPPILLDTYQWDVTPSAAGPPRTVKRVSDGGSFVYTDYDTFGNVLSRTDTATDATTRFEYDRTTSRLCRVFDAECVAAVSPACPGPLATFAYDPVTGNLTTITEREATPGAGEAVTTLEYDEKGRVIRVIAPDDSVTSPTHATDIFYNDGAGLGNVARIEQHSASLPAPLITLFGYDAAGNVTMITDPELNITEYVYDGNGRVRTIKDALLGETVLDYDQNGNMETVTDAKLQTTTFEYDVRDRLKKRIAPDLREERYTYTPGDLVSTYTNQSGAVTTFHYDSLGRLFEKILPNGEGSYHYDHDARGRMTSAYGPGPDSELRYDYAFAGRVVTTSITGSLLPATTQLVSTRDRNGFRTNLDASGALSLSLSYVPDSVGRPWTISEGSNPIAEYQHDLVGQRTSVAFDGHTTPDVNYTYDDLGRLTGLSNAWNGTAISSFSYLDYDGVGNYRQRDETRSGSPGPTFDYTYDDLYRIDSVSMSSTPLESFCYDAVGNREPAPSCASGWTYQVPNRLIADTAWTYQYDLRGNPIAKTGAGGNFTLGWTSENQLTSIVGATPIADAKYDVFGRRVRKTWYESSVPKTRRYIYDGSDIIAEIDDLGTVTSFIHGPGIDQPLAMTRGGDRFHYFSDLLGSVTEVAKTSPSFQLRNRYAYSAFGETALTVVNAPEVESPFGYTGREWEKKWATGGGEAKSLYYYRARYFDPGVGRFLSEDPIGFGGGDVNLYGYVGNGPMTATDPSGLQRLNAAPIPEPGGGGYAAPPPISPELLAQVAQAMLVSAGLVAAHTALSTSLGINGPVCTVPPPLALPVTMSTARVIPFPTPVPIPAPPPPPDPPDLDCRLIGSPTGDGVGPGGRSCRYWCDDLTAGDGAPILIPVGLLGGLCPSRLLL